MVEPVGQAVKDQIAVLFAQGASPFDIRLATGVNRHVVFRQMRRLRRPPLSERVRSPLRFSLTEREEISRGLAGGCSLRSIAAGLGRAPSSVSREVARNGGRRSNEVARCWTLAQRSEDACVCGVAVRGLARRDLSSGDAGQCRERSARVFFDPDSASSIIFDHSGCFTALPKTRPGLSNASHSRSRHHPNAMRWSS